MWNNLSSTTTPKSFTSSKTFSTTTPKSSTSSRMFDPAPLLLSSVQDLNLQDEPASNLDKIQNLLTGKVTLKEDNGIEYDDETDDDEAHIEEQLGPRRRGKDQDWKRLENMNL